MNPEEIREACALHALGLLEEPELSQLQTLLRQQDPEAAAGMRRALELTLLIGLHAPEVEVPKRLRARVLASVGGGESKRSWVPAWAALAAGLTVAVVWLAVQDRNRVAELADARRELVDARREVQQSNAELSRVQQAIALLNQPETRQATFGRGQPAPPRGRVFVSGSGVLLLASNLPALAADRTFELWVIPKAGAPIPSGLFRPDPNGNVLFLSGAPVDLATLNIVAVSVEPSSGSPAPTTTPIIMAPVGE